MLRKRDWLSRALAEKGWSLLHPETPPENAASILSFFHPDRSSEEIHQRLEAAQIIVSLRTDRSGRKYLRVSPHFYNTDAELHRLLELL